MRLSALVLIVSGLCFSLPALGAQQGSAAASSSSNPALVNSNINHSTSNLPSESATQNSSSQGPMLRAPISSQASESNPAQTSSVASSSQNRPGSLVNPMSAQGILASQNGHQKHGVITRAMGGLVSDAAHATMALVGTTILNQGIDLPPDDASAPEWPFNEPHRKAIYTVSWADGSTANISRLPDGSLQILGSGKRYVLQPESGGSYALLGDYGSFATITPRLGGGYTIIKADGVTEQVLPREGGGFVVEGPRGVVATILPGVGGKKHIIRGSGYSSGFIF